MSEPEAPPGPESDAPPGPELESVEYPPEVWPRLYGAVLGLLVLDIVVFGLVTVWFS